MRGDNLKDGIENADGCVAAPDVVCFRDTAFAHTYPGEAMPVTMKDWLFIGHAGDSVEFRVPTGGYIWTNVGVERDAAHNNVDYFRYRLTRDRLIHLWITLDGVSDSIPYTLSFRRIRPQSANVIAVKGLWSTLRLDSTRNSDRFSVTPIALDPLSDPSDWVVGPGSYNVPMLGDSLYKICRIPCTIVDTVRLSAGKPVIKRL